jgi:hypothetical protein
VAIQPDGKIVIGGGFTNVNGASFRESPVSTPTAALIVLSGSIAEWTNGFSV